MKKYYNIFEKVEFDVHNPAHLDRFDSFMRTGKWDICPFKLIADYETIPGMILDLIRIDFCEKIR